MKFMFITDSHWGGRDEEGFQMQPRYPEHTTEILQALDRVIRREAVELVIHGGDITDDGTAEQICQVAKMYREHLSAPVILATGNHDTQQPDCDDLWLRYAPGFFPANTMDTTLVCDGLRLDILSLHWGTDKRSWSKDAGQKIQLAPGHLERLRSGRQDLPRIIVMHAQIRPILPEKTHFDEPFLVPENNFSAVGDALIAEFHPAMILSGHNHLNLLDPIDGTMAVSGSSLVETPFEYKLVEFTNGVLSMQTRSLAEEINFPHNYWQHQQFVQGSEAERSF